MIHEVNNETMIQYFNDRLRRFGDMPETVGYSEFGQFLRFSILCEIGNLENHSILDIGCGLADLYKYLEKNNIPVKYTGYDISKKLINLCKKKYPLATFKNIDIFGYDKITSKFDYIILSGIFTSPVHTGEIDYVKRAIKIMYDRCNIGLSFNMLGTYVDYFEPQNLYVDPAIMFSYCKTITTSVALRCDYNLHDFTIYMYKKQTKQTLKQNKVYKNDTKTRTKI